MKAFEARRRSEFDDTPCAEPGCTRLTWTDGYCSTHSRRPLEAVPEISRAKPVGVKPLRFRTCNEEGCDSPHHAKGRCAYHYCHARYQAQKRAGIKQGTRLSEQSQALLDAIGIPYHTWRNWHSKGWIAGGFEDVDIARLTYLVRASKMRGKSSHGPTIPEIADQLEREEA